MTELVYVPKKHVYDWMKKGWQALSEIDKRDWAVLMAPPGWEPETKHALPKQETSPHDGGGGS